MATRFRRVFYVWPLLLATSCASATDRYNEGLELEAQGRYMEAAYRYADSVEKDLSLQEARDRLLIVGDSAVVFALEEAEYLDGRGEPVSAARQFLEIDRLMSRVRSVGIRLTEPRDYRVVRRTAFDRAIGWYMIEGEDASREGRWEAAVGAFAAVRSEFSPTREQSEASMDGQTRVLIDWAEVELGDRRPRAAYGIAERALDVRRSTPRPILLEIRDQGRSWVTYEVGDTVTYRVFSGERVVQAEAEVLLVNLDGRAVAEFTITSERSGSFREGEFDGDPWQLRLNRRDAPLFDC